MASPNAALADYYSRFKLLIICGGIILHFVEMFIPVEKGGGHSDSAECRRVYETAEWEQTGTERKDSLGMVCY